MVLSLPTQSVMYITQWKLTESPYKSEAISSRFPLRSRTITSRRILITS